MICFFFCPVFYCDETLCSTSGCFREQGCSQSSAWYNLSRTLELVEHTTESQSNNVTDDGTLQNREMDQPLLREIQQMLERASHWDAFCGWLRDIQPETCSTMQRMVVQYYLNGTCGHEGSLRSSKRLVGTCSQTESHHAKKGLIVKDERPEDEFQYFPLLSTCIQIIAIRLRFQQ